MKARNMFVLALAIISIANVGCCARFRNWLHRGSPCGTTTVAPAMMGSPVALGTPYVAPQQLAPQMMQPMVMPQANCQCAPQQCVPQCAPQCVPQQCMPQCMPMCQPSFDPCSNMCNPCESGTWSGGYLEGNSGGCLPTEGMQGTETTENGSYIPAPSISGQETYAPQGSVISPGPAPTTSNFPEPEKKE